MPSPRSGHGSTSLRETQALSQDDVAERLFTSPSTGSLAPGLDGVQPHVQAPETPVDSTWRARSRSRGDARCWGQRCVLKCPSNWATHPAEHSACPAPRRPQDMAHGLGAPLPFWGFWSRGTAGEACDQ